MITVPQELIQLITKYGDERADDNLECAKTLGEIISAIQQLSKNQITALTTSTELLNDFIAIYASDQCGEDQVLKASRRFGEKGGVLYRTATVLSNNCEVLAEVLK